MMNNWSDDLRRDPPIWVQIPVPPFYSLTSPLYFNRLIPHKWNLSLWEGKN